jgi:serine/threonine-protein kinase ATR
VKHFGFSLLYGNQYIYQSMPRLLSLWLDYGTLLAEYESPEKQKLQPHNAQKIPGMRVILSKLNKVCSTTLPSVTNPSNYVYIS